MNKIKLYKPIEIDGKEVKEMTPDFDSLPSNAISRAQNFLLQRKYQVNNPGIDVELHCLLCGLASDVAFEDSYRLHPKDKMRLAAESITFFNTDSEDTSE